MPNNDAIFNAVLAGAGGSMQERWITSSDPAVYSNYVNKIAEIAAAVDSQILPGTITTGQRALMQSITQGVFSGRFPQIDVYDQIADSIVNLYDALSTELTPEGVVPTQVAPFKATYYVDPSFTGVQTGSQSNPYTTIAAAFAAMLALAYSGGIIKIPPNTTITENIVFPATGGNWEIACDSGFVSTSVGPRIVGSITCDVTSGQLVARLSNLIVTGNTTGNSGNGTALVLNEVCVRQNGSVTLTKTGSGLCIGLFRGIGPAYAGKPSGSNTAAVSVAGQIIAENWVFEGGCTEALATIVTPYVGSTWRSCQLGSTNGTPVTMNLNGASNAFFYDCISAGPVTLASTTVNYSVYMDGATFGALTNFVSGLVLSGTGMTLKTINANASTRQTISDNVASTPLSSRNVDGLYEIIFDCTLLAGGTNGLLQLNVIYTDMTGTLVTVPVGGTLNIAGAVGSKVQGSLAFRHNGAAAPIAYSFTGVVTPGAMSVAASVAVMCRT